MIDLQRRDLLTNARNNRERHLAAAGGRLQIDRVERLQRGLQHGIGFKNDAVLIGVGIDRRDDALAEGIVEGVVDRGWRDAKASGRVAVNVDIGDEPLRGEIAGDVGPLRQLVTRALDGANRRIGIRACRQSDDDEAIPLNESRVGPDTLADQRIAGPLQAMTELGFGVLLVTGTATRVVAAAAGAFLFTLWLSELGTSWFWELAMPIIVAGCVSWGRAGRTWGVDGVIVRRSPGWKLG